MKKLISLLLVLLLPLTAMAATVTQMPEDCYGLMAGGLVLGMDYPESWLMNAAGEAVSQRYVDLDGSPDVPLAVMSTSDELNADGLINTATGEVVIPAQYGDVEIVSGSWTACAVLTPTDDPDAPYYDWSGNHYAIVTTDVYYGSTLVATLTAEESGHYDAYGAYLSVLNDNNVIWLDAAGNRRVCERYSDYRYEFCEDYDTGVVIHNGSGQQAFVASCTLMADEVTMPYLMTDAGVVDLQGNLLLSADVLPEGAQPYAISGEYLAFSCYIREEGDWHYGVLKLDGTVIVPFTAQELPTSGFLACGVLPVITLDNQLCYYDATGAVVASMPMPEGATRYDVSGLNVSAPALVVKTSAGHTVLSATAGVLDVSAYAEVRLLGATGLMAVKQNDKWGVLDANGAVIVPCELYNLPDVSLDGTLILGYVYDREAGQAWYLYDLEEN